MFLGHAACVLPHVRHAVAVVLLSPPLLTCTARSRSCCCTGASAGIDCGGVAAEVLFFPKSNRGTGRTCVNLPLGRCSSCRVEGGQVGGSREAGQRDLSDQPGFPTGCRCPADPDFPSHVSAGPGPAWTEGRAPRLPVAGDLQLLTALQVRREDGQLEAHSQGSDLRGLCSVLPFSCFSASVQVWGRPWPSTVTVNCAAREPEGLTGPWGLCFSSSCLFPGWPFSDPPIPSLHCLWPLFQCVLLASHRFFCALDSLVVSVCLAQ